MKQRGLRLLAKQTIDRAAAAAGLAATAPLFAAIAAGVYATMGRPIFFRQERPGLGGKSFHILKFRTMREKKFAGEPDAARITPLGRILRATSADELPQLINVLAGELSLVGPRPLLTNYLQHYSPDQARRHDVLPGITGWAQINGRNAISWEEKFALDVWYVDHWSLALDLQILARTAGQVIFPRGISRPGHATMPEFTGSAR